MENQSWSNVTSKTRHRLKPGKFSNLKKSSASSTPEVEMNFNEKWNPQTGTWDSSQSHKYTTRSTNRNQESPLNKSNIVSICIYFVIKTSLICCFSMVGYIGIKQSVFGLIVPYLQVDCVCHTTHSGLRLQVSTGFGSDV